MCQPHKLYNLCSKASSTYNTFCLYTIEIKHMQNSKRKIRISQLIHAFLENIALELLLINS